VGSGYGYLADSGSFTISAGVERQKLEEAISVCLYEARRIADELVSDEELQRAKDHTVGRFRLSLETAYSLGQRHGEQLLTRGSIETIDDFVAGIEAITSADVQRVARRLLGGRPFHCAVVGPRPDDDAIARLVEG